MKTAIRIAITAICALLIAAIGVGCFDYFTSVGLQDNAASVGLALLGYSGGTCLLLYLVCLTWKDRP